MTRAERRRLAALRRRRDAELKDGLHEMHAESLVWNFGIVRPGLAAITDPVIAPALAEWLRAILSGRHDPMCLLCDTRSGLDASAFFLMVPRVAAPANAVLWPLCRTCAAASSEALLAAAREKWRPALIGLRDVARANLFDAGGRA